MANTPDLSVYDALLEDIMQAYVDAFVADPSAETFEKNLQSVLTLERVFNLKSLIDAATTRAAAMAQAGKYAASSKVTDFLTEVLGLSRREAARRRRLAEVYYPETVESTPDSVARHEAITCSAQHCVSAEKHLIIAGAVKDLHEGASITPAQLVAEATTQAVARSPEDLRTWIRQQVADANSVLAPDHTRALRKRSFHIGQVDKDGGCRFSGYAPAGLVAMMDAAITPRARRGVLASTKTDKRTLDQRRADALWHVFDVFNQHDTTNTRSGIGSIVLCVSPKDLDHAPTGGYSTNTRAALTPLEVLQLGAAKYDFLLAMDPDTGDPLRLGRAKRLSNVEQKLALQARQQVCSHPGCEQPVVSCDAHHLVAWAKGGFTDIENLTLLCKHHHSENDDDRSSPHRGFAERCARNGRVGFRAPEGQLRFNDTVAAHRAIGRRTAERQWE